MDHDPNIVPVRSTLERRREPVVLTAAIAALLVLAIVKPWSSGAPNGGHPTSSLRPRASESQEVADGSSPSPRPREDPNGMLCFSGDAEQVVLLERWPGNELRSWIVATDRPVSGPLDPTITGIDVYSGHVIGVGICAPQAIGGAAAARVRDVQVLRQGERGPEALDLGLPDPITGPTDTPDAAVLVGSPRPAPPGPSARPRATEPGPATFGPGPVATPWPAGSYVIAFVFPADPSGGLRWLRINLLDPASPG